MSYKVIGKNLWHARIWGCAVQQWLMVQSLFRSVKICWCPSNLGLCHGEPSGSCSPFTLKLWIFSWFWNKMFDLSCSDLCVRGIDKGGAFPLPGSLTFTNIAEAGKLNYDHWLPLCETARQLEAINRQQYVLGI